MQAPRNTYRSSRREQSGGLRPARPSRRDDDRLRGGFDPSGVGPSEKGLELASRLRGQWRAPSSSVGLLRFIALRGDVSSDWRERPALPLQLGLLAVHQDQLPRLRLWAKLIPQNIFACAPRNQSQRFINDEYENAHDLPELALRSLSFWSTSLGTVPALVLPRSSAFTKPGAPSKPGAAAAATKARRGSGPSFADAASEHTARASPPR